MNLRFLLREIAHSKSQSVVFVLCVALSLISIVAVNSLRRDVNSSIMSDARSLHGGDIIVHSHYEYSPGLKTEIVAVLANGTVQAVQTWEFYSVARREDGRESLLSNIKVVQDGYPFYGQVLLQSGRPFSSVLQPGKVVVAGALLKRLGLAVGDSLRLGEADLEIADVVLSESLRPVDFFNFGPRILVSAADLNRLDLVSKGSRVHYRTLLRLEDENQISTVALRLQERSARSQERVTTFANTESRVKRFFDNLLFFLSLISVFTLLLAGIGMQSSLAALLRRKEKTFAMTRSLGASGFFLTFHYLLLVMVLSCIGWALGIGSGFMVERNFSHLFGGLLPAQIDLGVSALDILEGIGLGVLAVLFFTYLPLSGIKKVKPSAIFRKETDYSLRGGRSWGLFGCGLLLLFWLVIYQLEDVRIGLYFIGGFLVLVAFTALLVSGMLFALSHIKTTSLSLRQAVRSLLQPGNATRSIVVTLASSLAVLLTIFLVEHNLFDTYINSYPKDAPSLFCLDIQKNQQKDFVELVGADTELFPVIRARLTSINGKKISRQDELKKRGDSLAREFNLTYRESLLDDEVFLQGKSLFPEQNIRAGIIPVSILDTVADMGDIKMADVLLFNVQGVPLKAQVSSIRSRTKSMLYPFFYYVFPEKYLRTAPQTFFAAMHVEKEMIPQLENDIVNRFPNVSTINVSETAAELGKIMLKLSTIITFFASFSILAGALILVSSILATRMARVREAVYYKILGAGARFVLQVFLFENCLLALLSGGCAIVLGQFGSWAVCSLLLDIDYNPHWKASVVLLVGTVVLVLTLGVVSSYSIIRRKPASFLREQLS